MALGCGLTSVRGNRGENYENEPLVRQKHIKKKKNAANIQARHYPTMRVLAHLNLMRQFL
jgi:hypothetical protein